MLKTVFSRKCNILLNILKLNLSSLFCKHLVQISTFPLMFPMSFQVTDILFSFLFLNENMCVHFCLIDADNPPRDISFVLKRFIGWNIRRILAYFTSLTLEKNTFKMYSLLFYDECKLLN